MADRGRKAFPVSSHLCDERWQRHCMELHKQRLGDMKHRIDNTKPETYDLVLSKGKRHMLEKERQTEVDRENAILLQKMVRIKEQDTRAVFRPWTARSTFQWKAGHYYDAATNTKTLDHINLTSSVSPRSIHYFALTRPGTAPPDVTARLRDMEVQVDNTKLLRAITSMRTHYSNEVFEKRHADESILVQRISNFRGPDTSRYLPTNRSTSASRSSVHLTPLNTRSSSTQRSSGRPSPRAGWPAQVPPLSQQRYYEDAQNRDIPLPSSHGNSRPGTALGGTQEGLGETSPRASATSRRSLSSRHSSSSRHSGDTAPQAQGSAGGAEEGSRPGSAPHAAGKITAQMPAASAGTSFSFGGAKPQEQDSGASGQQRKYSGSSSSSSSSSSAGSKRGAAHGLKEEEPRASAEDGDADDPYEQDTAEYEPEQDERRVEEDEATPRDHRKSTGSSSGSGVKARSGDDEAAMEPGNSRYDDDFADDEAQEREGKPGRVEERAEAFDSEESELRAEMKAAEDEEMNRESADEIAADAGDDNDIGGGASRHVGGFAADWD